MPAQSSTTPAPCILKNSNVHYPLLRCPHAARVPPSALPLVSLNSSPRLLHLFSPIHKQQTIPRKELSGEVMIPSTQVLLPTKPDCFTLWEVVQQMEQNRPILPLRSTLGSMSKFLHSVLHHMHGYTRVFFCKHRAEQSFQETITAGKVQLPHPTPLLYPLQDCSPAETT